MNRFIFLLTPLIRSCFYQRHSAPRRRFLLPVYWALPPTREDIIVAHYHMNLPNRAILARSPGMAAGVSFRGAVRIISAVLPREPDTINRRAWLLPSKVTVVGDRSHGRNAVESSCSLLRHMRPLTIFDFKTGAGIESVGLLVILFSPFGFR